MTDKVLVTLLANISVSANTSVLLIWEMTYRYQYQPIFRHYQYQFGKPNFGFGSFGIYLFRLCTVSTTLRY